MRYKKSIKILNLIMIKSLKSKVGQKNLPKTIITIKKFTTKLHSNNVLLDDK